MIGALTFVTVVYEVEQPLLRLQARSMAKYLDPGLAAGLIVIDNSKPRIRASERKALLSEYGDLAERVEIITPADLGRLPHTDDYRGQQVLKLIVARMIDAPRYVVLDAKNHLVAPMSASWLTAADGRIRVNVHGYETHPHRRGLEAVIEYYRLKPELIHRFTNTITPFTMDTAEVLSLMADTESRLGVDFAHGFLANEMTEFQMYTGWILSRGTALEQHFELRQVTWPIVWSHIADPEGVRQTIALAGETTPLFSVHRAALSEIGPDAATLLASFWVSRGLFPSEPAALTFIARFQRRSIRKTWRRKARHAPRRALRLLGAATHRDGMYRSTLSGSERVASGEARPTVTDRPDLVLFTRGFPYDGSESVLSAELAVTSRRFRRIFVLPALAGTIPVALPGNAMLVDLNSHRYLSRADKLKALLDRNAIRVAAETLRQRSNWRPYASGIKFYLDVLAQNIVKAQVLSDWIKAKGLQDAIFYDYWFENATLALALLRREGLINCAVSRAHGFDIFDWRWTEVRRVPFRDFKANGLDAVFAVSDDGASYLRRRVGRCKTKVHVARLGVSVPDSPLPPAPKHPVIVSCSALRPGKQVHLIPPVLAAIPGSLSWVHFGDGPERKRVEQAASKLPSRIDWRLAGQVDNTRVLEYYESDKVSVLLSLSRFEGIPISMMEAQSRGIPVVALSVGGIPELVTADTGVLISPGASVPSIAQALESAVTPGRFDHAKVRQTLRGNYDAAANYERFAESLLSIWRHNHLLEQQATDRGSVH